MRKIIKGVLVLDEVGDHDKFHIGMAGDCYDFDVTFVARDTFGIIGLGQTCSHAGSRYLREASIRLRSLASAYEERAQKNNAPKLD